MFGFDWDNDGKEDLFDDMLTIEFLTAIKEDDEDVDYDESYDVIGRPSGSCLVTVLMMGAAFMLPILGMLKFCV